MGSIVQFWSLLLYAEVLVASAPLWDFGCLYYWIVVIFTMKTLVHSATRELCHQSSSPPLCWTYIIVDRLGWPLLVRRTLVASVCRFYYVDFAMQNLVAGLVVSTTWDLFRFSWLATVHQIFSCSSSAIEPWLPLPSVELLLTPLVTVIVWDIWLSWSP